jgi:membrane associated rhomboid family serine protease
MLVIPIGQEHGEVRRQPWVSYGIVAFNVVVFLFLWLASNQSDVPGKFESQARVVTDYLIRNPYLTVPPELTAFYGRRGMQLLGHAKAVAAPPDAWIVRRQQQKLNAMAQELFAIGRELPLLKPGFVPAKPDAFAALSSLFVHASLLHLLGNMLFFFATGPFLEDVLGRFLFAALYILSGFAALAVHTWQNPGSLAPVVGASGAIAGIMGAFLVRLRTSRIRMLFVPIILLPWVRFRFLIPAFVFLPLWFIGQFWLATSTFESGAVALWAHVGGFVFGAVAMLLILLLGVEKRWIHPGIEAQVGWSQNPGLVAALEAQSRGDLQEARKRTETVLKEDPSNVDAQRFAYDLALQDPEHRDLGREAARLLDLYVARSDDDLATQLIGEASAHDLELLPLRFHQRAASFLDRQGDEAWAFRFHRKIADGYPDSAASLHSLIRIADFCRKDGDLRGARDALRRAEQHPDCNADWREMIRKKTPALDARREMASDLNGSRTRASIAPPGALPRRGPESTPG